MPLGNLIPRVCNQLPLMSQTGKSVRTSEPKPGVQGSFLKRNGGEREVAGLGLGDKSVVVFRERGCR